MKKTLALLVAAVLAVTALCACLTVSAEVTNLALNADFIGADPTVGNQYTDKYNAKLNDGKAETEANWAEKPGEWFGFYYNASLPSNAESVEGGALATFTVDLKAPASVDSVRIHTITSAAYDGNGVVAPQKLTVEYSSDNENWTTLGELNDANNNKKLGKEEVSDFAGYKDIDWVEVKGDAPVSARYIRISIKFRGYTFMLNEVEVLGTAAGSEESGEAPTETSSEESKAPVPTEIKNVAEGKKYTGAEPSTHPNNVRYNAKLTDGVAKDSLSDLVEGDWFAFYYNDGAEGINAPDKVGTIVVDLEEVYTVSSVKINTFVGNMWGIVPPESIKVEYSEDGETYTVLDEKSFTAPEKEKGEDGKEIEVDKVEFVEFKGEADVDARYIKVTVKLNGIFAFLNEIQVMGAVPAEGDDPSTGSTDTPSESAPATSTGSTASTGSTGSTNPPTGDAGILGLAILATVALAGAVVAVKVRR